MKHLFISLLTGIISTSIIYAQDQVIFESSIVGETVLKVEHFDNTDGLSHAIEGISIEGLGVFGKSTSSVGVRGNSTEGFGVIGQSVNDIAVFGWSLNSHGAIFSGKNSGGFADIVLEGGNWNGDSDDGVIMSDPDKTGSDLFIVSNDAVVIELDNDDGESGHFQVWNGDDELVLRMGEDGQFEIWNGAALNDRKLLLESNGDLTIEGALTENSDRNSKEDIIEINYSRILSSVLEIPVYEWQYKGQNRRHIGPMAQDFHAAFGLGEDDTGIANLDVNGVVFASIKALYNQNVEQQSEIDALKQELTEIKALLKAKFIKTFDD